MHVVVIWGCNDVTRTECYINSKSPSQQLHCGAVIPGVFRAATNDGSSAPITHSSCPREKFKVPILPGIEPETTVCEAMAKRRKLV